MTKRDKFQNSRENQHLYLHLVLTSTFPRFQNDKGLYENCSKLNENKMKGLLLAGPCQPKECDLLGREFKQFNDKRRL